MCSRLTDQEITNLAIRPMGLDEPLAPAKCVRSMLTIYVAMAYGSNSCFNIIMVMSCHPGYILGYGPSAKCLIFFGLPLFPAYILLVVEGMAPLSDVKNAKVFVDRLSCVLIASRTVPTALSTSPTLSPK